VAGGGWYEPLLDLLPSPLLLIAPATGRVLVTDLEVARRRSDALADASAMLAGSLDFDATLQAIARLAVPRLADWCFVELLRDDGSIDRVAIEADDPAVLERAREYDRRYPLDPDSPVGSPQVIRSGEPDLQPEIPDAMLELAAQDAEHLEILRSLGFRSSMIVPLRAGGRVVGDVALVSSGSGRRFGPADLAAAQELADRCGLYLENARLYRELERAHDELEAILGGLADAVTVQAADGRLTYVNDAAVRLLGEPLGLHDRASLVALEPGRLAAAYEMIGEDGRPFPAERLPGRLAFLGEEPDPVILRFRARATGESGWSRVKARPLRGPDGSVVRGSTSSRTSPTSSTPRSASGCSPRPAACSPGRSTTRTRSSGSPRSPCPTSPTGAWSTWRASAGSSASRSRTPTPRGPTWPRS
jgi:PAS domain-containing protein